MELTFLGSDSLRFLKHSTMISLLIGLLANKESLVESQVSIAANRFEQKREGSSLRLETTDDDHRDQEERRSKEEEAVWLPWYQARSSISLDCSR